MTSNEVDHSIDLGSDFSKFLFEDQLADIKIHVSRVPPEQALSPEQLSDAIAATEITPHPIEEATACTA